MFIQEENEYTLYDENVGECGNSYRSWLDDGLLSCSTTRCNTWGELSYSGGGGGGGGS
jgi:hypothetical protein